MSAGVQYPSVKPFCYVLIPAEDSAAVTECRFEGHSEEALRHRLTRHFRHVILSDEQRSHMAAHLAAKAKESAAKHSVNNSNNSNEAPQDAQLLQEQQQRLIEQYLDDCSFEIVPVTMPTRQTGYIGTSLYIDDSGAFKELPLNSRASRIAQREIRGDAFLLANHDDPALEEWGRVDCTLQDYRALHATPPTTHYDTSNTAQMTQAALLRDAEAKRVSAQDIAQAAQAKEDGNRLIAGNDLKAAVQAYSQAIELTEGRRDLLPDEAAATQLRVSALLNRSLCLTRLLQYDDAARDARTAAQLDAGNCKAYYRLASALLGGRDFDAAADAVTKFEQHGGSGADAAALRKAIAAGSAKLKAEERKRYAHMFDAADK